MTLRYMIVAIHANGLRLNHIAGCCYMAGFIAQIRPQQLSERILEHLSATESNTTVDTYIQLESVYYNPQMDKYQVLYSNIAGQ